MFLLLSTACTIQKRHYRKGYYVSWNKNYYSNLKNETKSLKVEKTKPKTELKILTIKKDTTQPNKTEKKVSIKTRNSKQLKSSELKKEPSKSLDKTTNETQIVFKVSQSEIITNSTETDTNNVLAP
jgi:hypothetical protein